jgi:hypothetical protein
MRTTSLLRQRYAASPDAHHKKRDKQQERKPLRNVMNFPPNVSSKVTNGPLLVEQLNKQ